MSRQTIRQREALAKKRSDNFVAGLSTRIEGDCEITESADGSFKEIHYLKAIPLSAFMSLLYKTK